MYYYSDCANVKWYRVVRVSKSSIRIAILKQRFSPQLTYFSRYVHFSMSTLHIIQPCHNNRHCSPCNFHGVYYDYMHHTIWPVNASQINVFPILISLNDTNFSDIYHQIQTQKEKKAFMSDPLGCA